MPHAETKPAFTVAEANKVLPLVRSIVTDVVADAARLQEIGVERRALETRVDGAVHPTPSERAQERKATLERLRAEAEDRARRVDGYARELSELGVALQDPARGLVDFPSERLGRPVHLCWILGEAAVTHWHGLDESFADRRPIDPPKRPAPEKRTAGDTPA